jgi:hypothetical protein
MRSNLNPILFSDAAGTFTKHTFIGLFEGEFIDEHSNPSECYFARYRCEVTGNERMFGAYDKDPAAMLNLFGIAGPKASS